MMINKRLIGTVKESNGYIVLHVALLLVSLGANISVILTVASFLEKLATGQAVQEDFFLLAIVLLLGVGMRFFCTVGCAKLSFLSAHKVKITLRRKLYEKLLALGASYRQRVATAEIVQVAVEGADQLEIYFSAYLPQLFYSLLAPLTLFGVMCFISVHSGLVLLLCVPLIPIAIAAVQTFAKKLLAAYWGKYTALGDSFLENLQGLTTLKIYSADEKKQTAMKAEAEQFRRITMRVLTMQLNSVTVMDVIAYGGAALGVISSALQYQAGSITLAGAVAIILLSADFFLPMRLLGSYFHIAMNGMAAADKIFRVLDFPQQATQGSNAFPKDCSIACQNLRFFYTSERAALSGVTMQFKINSFTAIVGESGCGKSTLAGVLTGRNQGFEGVVTVGGTPLTSIAEDALLENITYIGFESYLFSGTIRDNLCMAAPQAQDAALWSVLEQVKLAEFLRTQKGLETVLLEQGSNFSGGQRQRLALARAILHDSPIYIFDEATSNVDAQSENEIMQQIHALAQTKTVLLITHRLANAIDAQSIYVMEQGKAVQQGTHESLLAQKGAYAKLWHTQSSLEQFQKEAM